MSRVKCQVSGVRCHVSRVTCHMIYIYIYIFWNEVLGLAGVGYVINGPTPSSFTTGNLLDVGDMA